MLQAINTLELTLDHNCVETMFSIGSSCGATAAKSTADRRLKKMADEDKCYYDTYCKKRKVTYKAVGAKTPKECYVCIKDCYAAILIDQIVRLQYPRNPERSKNNVT